MQSFKHKGKKKLLDYSTTLPVRVKKEEGMWNKNIKEPKKGKKNKRKALKYSTLHPNRWSKVQCEIMSHYQDV